MTRQILLKTPRGNTAVIPVDHIVSKSSLACVGSGSTYLSSKEETKTYNINTAATVARATEVRETEVDGDIAVIDITNIFDNGDVDVDRQCKEELLHQLIEASRQRDVGRKRNIQYLFNHDDDGARGGGDDMMDIDDGYCGGCRADEDSEKEEKSVTTMIDGIDINSDYFYSNKSQRRLLSCSAGRNSNTRRRQHRPLLQQGRDDNVNPLFQQQPRRKEQRRHQLNPQQQQHQVQVTAENTISCSSPSSLMVAFYHQGRKVSLDRIWDWITGSSLSSAATSSSSETSSSSTSKNKNMKTAASSSIPQFPLYLTLSTSTRLLGGIDRQNRVGSKFGGGGVSSSQNAERERKERLKQLALESIDLAKDPYLMRNHLGTYECKLCLTLHTNEANYLAHTQGKKQ